MNHHYIIPIISLSLAVITLGGVVILSLFTWRKYKATIASQQETIALLHQALQNKTEHELSGNGTRLIVDDTENPIVARWLQKPDQEELTNRTAFLIDDYNQVFAVGDEPLEIIDIRPGEHGIQKYNLYAKLITVNGHQIKASATLTFILEIEMNNWMRIINYKDAMTKCFDFYDKMAQDFYEQTKQLDHSLPHPLKD